MTPHPARARARRLLLLGGLLALAGCGGGGGGGGGDGGGSPIGGGGGPTAGATFDGFSFRTGPSSAPSEFTTPPVEDLSASPPKIGAPLDLVVVFHFDPSDSAPAGPFTQTSLPVFTTPGQMPAEAVPPNVSLVAAKGTYVQVDPHTIEFRPFLPQDPLSINPASSPDSIPGFIPGATYTAKVETTPGLKISNLVGPGGSVEFGITTLPGGFFSDSGDDLPPTLISSFPPDGASDFYPGLFSNTPAGGDEQTFQPHGPATIDLVYDHGVAPTVENLDGKDWNGDGLTDPNFFLRCRASKLLVSHTVPAGAFNGGEPEFAALSGLDEDAGAPGLVVNPNGLDIFMHNSGGPFSGPGQDPALVAAPVALAAGADPSLTFALFAGAGDDSLTVIDHTLGDDPGPARIAAAAVTVPLDDGVGLITLLDGRLVAFDRTTRTIVELQPVVTRSLPLGVPTLESVSVGFTSAAFPALDVRDLAQAPSGALYALAVSGGGSSLVPLTPIDFDTNGSFDAGDGLPSGAAAIPLPSSGPYEGFEFLTETTALALQREADAVDQIDLPSLTAQRVVSDLAGFDTLDPGDPSPARAIVVAHMQLDVGVDLIDNQTARSEFLIDPLSVLPPSTAFDLMQRPNLASLGGISEANADSDAPGYVLGAKRLMSFRTADPANTRAECGEPDPEGRVHDVLQEEFVDQTLQDPNPTTLNPQADWGGESPGGQSSGRLTAVAGQAGGIQLGDFRPLPFPDFVADSGYSGAPGAVNNANWRILFLDTDVQHFPLPDGSTPGVTSSTTVVGGKFNFHDVVIPEGVWIMARGSKPLQITATGRVEIAGLIDASGGDGLSDSSFDTGFLPVPGGHGGPGGGRGGDAQPTLWNPKFAALISIQQTGQQAAQYVTPETAETGLGPVVGPTGNVSFLSVGGRGGLSTLGYDPNPLGYTKLNPSGDNTEYHRPPGGGGGTFYLSGDQAHVGSGGYRVQSNSTWPPYSKCPNQDWIRDAVYGNEEIKLLPLQFQVPSLQCVYLQGTPAAPEYFQPGGLPGNLVFKDGDFSNDYIGPGGEVPVLIGGQGGGGGGTRIDSFNSAIWACGSRTGFPCAFPQQPHYPALNFSNIYWSPSLFDAKGGGGGGGGGAVLIRAFGEIRLTRMGHIDASGGSGQGGEIVGNSNYSGGGGGGSGGAIVLQAGGDIILEADPQHRTPGFVDSSLAQGAALDVSGGIGYDASESPDDLASAPKSDHTVGRSDGGCGGFGLIQLQTGGPTGAPRIAQGAFAFARQQLQVKLGGWNGGSNLNQREHNEWTATAGPNNILRYIDMLEHRAFLYDPDATGAGGLGDPPVMTSTHLPWLVLQGSDPPIVTPSATVPPLPLQLDSVMVEHYGRRVVRDPKPEAIMASYFGYDPLTFKESNWCLACSPPKYLNSPPGVLYAPTDEIPVSRFLNRPDGTPLKQDPTTDNPFAEFAHTSTIDRLPVVPLHKVPPAIGAVSQGTSKWLDFNGVALRARDASGLTPPLFLGIHGTYNALLGTPPPGKEAQIVLGGPVSSPPGDTPAHFVDNTGDYPFDPGLCPDAEPTGSSPPFNDIKVDSPDYGLDNVVTDNAKVTLEFQGAFAIRAGSRVPDPATLTGWVSDVRDLSGYPLVRFRVTFDLGHNPSYPFSPDSKKPGVDTVRLRAKY